jgi:radical SAM superfamily enzyme YgiQ (UPF0313 family)
MKLTLVQPNLDKKHQNQRQAYGSPNRPPETGLAVLASWIDSYSQNQHETEILDPTQSKEFIAHQASQSEMLGITDWFSNHDNALEISRQAKQINPKLKVVFGGPNASMMPTLILRNHPEVDFVVSRDGEEALLGLAESKPIEQIPNIWYRYQGQIKFTNQKHTDLRKMPLWNFSKHKNSAKRLEEYLAAQSSGLDPWLTPPVTIFSFRGCMKAIREGVCSYCTSSEEKGRALPENILWAQIRHLNQQHNAEIFYMCDDIFTISPKRMKDIADSRPSDIKARIRAYSFLPDLAKLPQEELERLAKDLQKIGVFNLFFGSENYDPSILERMNKRGTTIEETKRVVKTIYDAGGIKTTIAYLLGLPGETKQSLDLNLGTLEQLLNINGEIERLYLSAGMPLIGTQWYQLLLKNSSLVREYLSLKGKTLKDEDSPDYGLLTRLSIKHTTSVNPEQINEYITKFTDFARRKMPEYRIGGFLLDLGDVN